MKYLATLFGILLLSLFLVACTSQTESSQDEDKAAVEEALTIYTTLYPLQDFAEKIGGSYVKVESIIPPGSDSHTYEPTSKEMVEIAKGDVFIYNGLGMETYAEKISSALENEDVLIVEATTDIETIEHSHDHSENTEDDGHDHEHGDDAETEDHGHDHEHGDDADAEDHDHDHEHGENADADEHEHDHEHGENADAEDHDHEHGEDNADEDKDHEHDHAHGDLDPHIWLDPYRSIKLAENIKNALVELMPEAAEEFEQNYESLKTELEKLDQDFHTLVDSKSNPEMIVSHAAYGYWEDTYGIHQIPIAGLSSSDEPSQKDLIEIVNLAKEKEINYIVFEQNVSPKVAEVIQEEINAEAIQLHNLSVLTDEDIENGEDYFSLMKRNLENLDKVLR
ncbi:metal ABC transporter solute-binding protein, Zn/Mn family [Ornithinibacillus salinisoli]|uniref:Metal ABC transporter solute-binding protein, Zn/Mn family n=1 Tax=Ornithinibacillus salinisoli TaxID=1848459 RepID=A0ABW4VY72_9BACI